MKVQRPNNILVRLLPQEGQHTPARYVASARYNYTDVDTEPAVIPVHAGVAPIVAAVERLRASLGPVPVQYNGPPTKAGIPREWSRETLTVSQLRAVSCGER